MESKKLTARKNLNKNFVVVCDGYYDKLYNEAYDKSQTINVNLESYELLTNGYLVEREGQPPYIEFPTLSIDEHKKSPHYDNRELHWQNLRILLLNDNKSRYGFYNLKINDDGKLYSLASSHYPYLYNDIGEACKLNIYSNVSYMSFMAIVSKDSLKDLDKTNLYYDFRKIAEINIPKHIPYQHQLNYKLYKHEISQNINEDEYISVYTYRGDNHTNIDNDLDPDNIYKMFSTDNNERWNPLGNNVSLMVDLKNTDIVPDEIYFWFPDSELIDGQYPNDTQVTTSNRTSLNISIISIHRVTLYDDNYNGGKIFKLNLDLTVAGWNNNCNEHPKYIDMKFKLKEGQEKLNLGKVIKIQGKYSTYTPVYDE